MNNLNDYTAYNQAKEAFLEEVDASLQVKYPVAVSTDIPYERVCYILEEYELRAEILGRDFYLVY